MEWLMISGKMWIVLVLLFAASVVFNEIVERINRESKGDHPLAAAGVVVGVAFTLVGVYFLGVPWEYILLVILAFVATGTPMLVGDVGRWLARQRKR